MALARHIQTHTDHESKRLRFIENVFCAAFSVINSPRSERITTRASQRRQLPELQPRALNVERCSINLQTVSIGAITDESYFGHKCSYMTIFSRFFSRLSIPIHWPGDSQKPPSRDCGETKRFIG